MNMHEQAAEILAGLPGKRGEIQGTALHIFERDTGVFWGVKGLTPSPEEQAVIDREKAAKRAAREEKEKARALAQPRQSPSAVGGRPLRWLAPGEKALLHRGFGSSVEGLVPDIANAQSFLEQAIQDCPGAPEEIVALVREAMGKLTLAQEWARKSWEVPEPRPEVTKAPF